MGESASTEQIELDAAGPATPEQPVFHCDRCGAPMIESRCKLICLNCGGRLDCSDLSIYLD